MRQIEEIVAEIAPRPDVPSNVRKGPGTGTAVSAPEPERPLPGLATSAPAEPRPAPTPTPAPRAVIEATAPARYRVQFTVGQATHDKL